MPATIKFSRGRISYASSPSKPHQSFEETSKFSQNELSDMATHESRTFPLFGLFPPEIRLQIWGLAVDSSRTVMVTAPTIVGCVPDDDCNCCAMTAKTQVPPLLLVSRESRLVALPKYKLSFASPVSQPHYFNFEGDTLFIRGQGRCYQPNQISAKIHQILDMEMVKNLAISWDELDLHFLSPELDFRKLGKNLEKLIVVMNAIPKGKGDLKLDSDLTDRAIPRKRLREVQGLKKRYFQQWKEVCPEWKEPSIEMVFLTRENKNGGNR